MIQRKIIDDPEGYLSSFLTKYPPVTLPVIDNVPISVSTPFVNPVEVQKYTDAKPDGLNITSLVGVPVNESESPKKLLIIAGLALLALWRFRS